MRTKFTLTGRIVGLYQCGTSSRRDRPWSPTPRPQASRVPLMSSQSNYVWLSVSRNWFSLVPSQLPQQLLSAAAASEPQPVSWPPPPWSDVLFPLPLPWPEWKFSVFLFGILWLQLHEKLLTKNPSGGIILPVLLPHVPGLWMVKTVYGRGFTHQVFKQQTKGFWRIA